MKKIIITLILAGCLCPALTGIRHIEFQQNCGGYLKQAADASSIELALDRLNKAIYYAEKTNLTKGYTSILWKTEDDNIGFWYSNLKSCQKELQDAISSIQLEQTNVLMKIRETLTDEGEKGTKLTLPKGISRYPDNSVFAFWNTVSIALIVIVFIV